MADLIITERSDMVALANAVRNKTSQTQELTFGEIITSINNISSGGSGGSMFTSTAVGIIPDISKGYANSTITIDFESSAIGSLS